MRCAQEHDGSSHRSLEEGDASSGPGADRPSERARRLQCALERSEPLCPLSSLGAVNEAQAALGEKLFQERALSGDRRVACSDCHLQEHGLADERPLSRAPGRHASAVNSPTLYNAVYSYRITWGARYDSLESHLDALIENPQIMASSWERASRQLEEQSGYRERFESAFPEGLTPATVRSALLEYERSLVTPNAPFDRYLLGDEEAISDEAKRGYSLFKAYGCASCHQGCGVGGNMLERLGILGDYFADRGGERPGDEGLFARTGNERDRHVFRVPSLRNVALTAPYFHDGSVGTLEEAIDLMARYQLGRRPGSEENHAIAEFLKTLTGRYRGRPI